MAETIWQYGKDPDDDYPGEYKPAARCITHVVKNDDGSETFYVNQSRFMGKPELDPRIVIKREGSQ